MVATFVEATPPGETTPPGDSPPAPPVASTPGSDVPNVPPDDAGPPPALGPSLVLLSYVGGAGDQYLTEVGFGPDGGVYARGKSFSLTYDAALESARVDGALDEGVDMADYTERLQVPFPPYGQAFELAAGGHTVRAGTDIVTGEGSLQMPWLASTAGWKNYGWTWPQAHAAGLHADGRLYDLWPLPGGRLGALLWASGGDTILRKEPQDLGSPADFQAAPAFSADAFIAAPGGRPTLYVQFDASTGRPLSGTFLANHVTARARDRWGRVYLPKTMRSADAGPANPFGQSESAASGVFVLGPNYARPELNARIGGDTSTCGATSAPAEYRQAFNVVALRDRWLVLGGTTCATDLPTTANAAQATNGGGQDGLIAVVRLW